MAYRTTAAAVGGASAIQLAVGVAHAALQLSPAQTLRNAALAAGTILTGGAVQARYRDPTGTPGLVFGGCAFPYILLLGHWWNTINARQRLLGAVAAATLSGILAVRAATIAPTLGRRRWWVRTFVLDNTLWWAVLFVTTVGLDSDIETDLARAMKATEEAAQARFDAAYAHAWGNARDRVASRAAIVDRALAEYGSELELDVAAAIAEDLAQVRAWLAEPS